jgi:hypothetical protein
VQVRAGLELWAQRAGAALRIEDDRSDPGRAARLHAELEAAGCRLVLGPYGSDTTRACARRGGVVWNHGAAADDVQRMAAVVSVPSPASRYLVALGRAVAELRPGARVTIAAGRGRFARLAAAGLEATAESLGLELLGRFPLTVPARRVLAAGADAVLACGRSSPSWPSCAGSRRARRTPSWAPSPRGSLTSRGSWAATPTASSPPSSGTATSEPRPSSGRRPRSC